MHGRMSASVVPSVRRSKDGLQIPASSAMEVLPPEPSSLQLPRISGAAQQISSTPKFVYRDGRPFSANANNAVSVTNLAISRPDTMSQTSDAGRPLSVDTGRSALRRRQDAAGRPPLDPSSLSSLGSTARGAAIRIPMTMRSPRSALLLSNSDEEMRMHHRRMDSRHPTADRRGLEPLARSPACTDAAADDDDFDGTGTTFFLTDVGLAAADPVFRIRPPSPSPQQQAEQAAARYAPSQPVALATVRAITSCAISGTAHMTFASDSLMDPQCRVCPSFSAPSVREVSPCQR